MVSGGVKARYPTNTVTENNPTMIVAWIDRCSATPAAITQGRARRFQMSRANASSTASVP